MAPKQATKGQKQIERENKSTITFYTYIISASYIPVLLLRLFYDYQNVGYGEWTMLIFSTIIFALCMKAMSSMANGGLDLNMHQGMGEHIKDILIVTAVCQALGSFSLYFWLIWILIPAVAIYKLWVSVIAPWIFQEAPAEPTEKQKRKLDKKMMKRQ